MWNDLTSISLNQMGLPRWHSSKESACQSRRHEFDPWAQRSPGEGNGNPLQCSCLGNPMDSGAWEATICGAAKSWTRLSYWARTHTEQGKTSPASVDGEGDKSLLWGYANSVCVSPFLQREEWKWGQGTPWHRRKKLVCSGSTKLPVPSQCSR